MVSAKLRSVAQVLGFLCMAFLTLYGALALFGGGALPAFARSAGAAAAPVEAPPAIPNSAPTLDWGGATIPLLMNYQGYLRDGEGDPLNGYYTMTLRIYAGVADLIADRLWEEQHTNVTVRDGQFSLLLGNTMALPTTLFASPDRFVGVTVHPYDEMVPRQRLASMPYAFHADQAHTLAAPDGNPQDAVTVDNNGNVDIGSMVNPAKVEIEGHNELLSLWNKDSSTVSSGWVGLSIGNEHRLGGNVNNWLSLQSFGDGYTGALGSPYGGDSLSLNRANAISTDGESLIFYQRLDKPFYFMQNVGGAGAEGPGRIALAIQRGGAVDVGSRLTLKGRDFSLAGSAEHSAIVPAPTGTTVNDWSIIVSPRNMGIEEIGSEGDNALLSFICDASPLPDGTGWRITASYKYRQTNSEGSWKSGSANYILIGR